MICADEGVIMGGSEHNIEKNPETLFVSRKEIFLEVNTDETK
jgi:hypothetical protein